MSMNFDNLFAQANQFKENMAQAKRTLAVKTTEVKGGQGAVSVIINGLGEIKEIRLSPNAMSTLGREKLQRVLTETVNAAFARSKDFAGKTMSELTGIDINSLSNLF
ncbi:YbaB/EbfC family nucleoid-associated protein [Bacillota bacterium LX-D]|nr:YbaB/EbfC family nucleoid-associated protein [Bacillota bacterium LX-D]